MITPARQAAGSGGTRTDSLDVWWFRGAVLMGAVAILLRHVVHANAADVDMFHEMALIREALAMRAFPMVDLWAYTPTVSPVVHHEWATGAVLYGLVVGAGLGWDAVKLLQFMLLGGIGLASYAAARHRGAHPLTAVLLLGVAALMLGAGLAAVRAQMFTYFFTAVMLLLLPQHERLRGWLLLIWLPLFALWVNMHGGFVVGLGLFGLYTAEATVRAALSSGNWKEAAHANRYLIGALPVMALLVFLTPYGIHYPVYVWHAIRLDRVLIPEWAPIWDPQVQPQLVIAFAVSILVALYAVLKSTHRRELTGLPLLVVAAYFTVQHQRMAPLYAVVWFCHMPAWLATTPLQPLILRLATRFRALIAAAFVALAVVTAAAFVEARSWQLTFPTQPDEGGYYYPVGAVRYLEETRFVGDVMTPYNVGAYVSWMMYPRARVSLDSRYEVAYPTDMADELIGFYHAEPGWEETLRNYPPDMVLAPAPSPISRLLNEEPHIARWREVYRDGGYVLFAQTDAADHSGTGSVVR